MLAVKAVWEGRMIRTSDLIESQLERFPHIIFSNTVGVLAKIRVGMVIHQHFSDG
jgi:hypothetical protein